MTIDKHSVKNALKMMNYGGCGFVGGALLARTIGNVHPLIKVICVVPTYLLSHKAAEMANDQLDIIFDEIVDPAERYIKKSKEKVVYGE